MSGSFFEELGIPEPDINLGAGGGSQAEQTAAIMTGYEKVLQKKRSSVTPGACRWCFPCIRGQL